MCDGLNSKAPIMTKLIYSQIVEPNTMITWRLSHEPWFMKDELSRNQKLKRFCSAPVSPLVIGMLARSKEIIKALLESGVEADKIDFGNDRGTRFYKVFTQLW